MSIKHFSFDHSETSYPEGAHSPIQSQYNENGRHIIYWETHKGLCLYEREMNGYDDSDFYMAVWNEEKQKVEEILFATTRGWTYPAFASYADATPEVIKKAEAWKRAKDRKERICKRWQQRKELISQTEATNLTRKQLVKLQRVLGPDFPAIYRLLKTKKFRSKFRASCADQVREWISQETPTYSTPLSRKQLSYL